MCNKREFNSKVRKYRELKLAMEAIEAQMKELKPEIIEYLEDHGNPLPGSDSTVYVAGPNFKAMYITCLREKVDKAKLKEFLGPGYSMYVTSSLSHQLRID